MNFVTNLDCILCSSAFCLQGQKTSSLGTLRQATFPYTNVFSNRNKQMQSQSCFLCKSLWNTSKHIFCLTIWPAQGDRLAELWKCLSDCFAEYFLSLSIEKNCKGEHQSEEFICVTNEEDSYLFLVVMKFAKLLMSALVSLSDDLVPVELFHLSC